MIPAPADLLVIGGLTVDRFADGSSAPGGAVIHVARAAALRSLVIDILTACGEEPEAEAGLAELRHIARVVECRPHGGSATFRHHDTDLGRRLWVERAGGPVEVDRDARNRIATSAILFAPVAGEIPSEALSLWDGAWTRGAILQGWLRDISEEREVGPLPLTALASGVVDALAGFDLLVASREDLLAESESPVDQLSGLRRAFGSGPELVVTDGANGLWLDMRLAGSQRSLRRHVAVPWRVDGVSTVGAGDILAAFLTMRLRKPAGRINFWAKGAMRVVAEVLEARRTRPRRSVARVRRGADRPQ